MNPPQVYTFLRKLYYGRRIAITYFSSTLTHLSVILCVSEAHQAVTLTKLCPSRSLM